jgi:hypothetical protein
MLNSVGEFLLFVKLTFFLSVPQRNSLHSRKMVSESPSKVNKVVMATCNKRRLTKYNNNTKKNDVITNFNSKRRRRRKRKRKSIFMYSQSDRFPVPVSMMGFRDSL